MINKKVIIVTGGTSGIGYETVKSFVSEGHFVIATGRNNNRIDKSKTSILKEFPKGNLVYILADLSSLSDVRNMCSEIKSILHTSGFDHIDALINNAGTFSSWYTSTAEGFELQFAVNHLAPSYLTIVLLPLLEKSVDARVINVSSGSHYRTRINWKDLQLQKRYSGLKAYKQTKLINLLFLSELRRKLKDKKNITIFAADPGLVNTEIGFKGTSGIERTVWKHRKKKGTTPLEGSKTSVFLVNNKEVANSQNMYWKNCSIKTPAKNANNIKFAKKIWDTTIAMCGIKSI